MNREEYEHWIKRFIKKKKECDDSIEHLMVALSLCYDYREKSLIQARILRIRARYDQIDRDLYAFRFVHEKNLSESPKKLIVVNQPNLPNI